MLTNQQQEHTILLDVDNSTKSYQEDLNMVLETIIHTLAERLDKDETEITAASSFQDLGIDSLDTVELLMELEDELGLTIDLEDKVETVGQLAAYIEKLQG